MEYEVSTKKGHPNSVNGMINLYFSTAHNKLLQPHITCEIGKYSSIVMHFVNNHDKILY